VNREKGQSVVEFALIIPLFLLLILGMIYGGFAYADYLQYSTSVREAARDIAIQKTAEKRKNIAESINGSFAPNVYSKPLTKLYAAKYSVIVKEPVAADAENPDADTGSVTVSVELTRDEDIRLLPEHLGPLQCTMPIEPVLQNTNQNPNP